VASFACNAQDVTTAKELSFQEIFASRTGDPRMYILLGGGWLRTIRSGNPSQFISDWLAAHPVATVKPISRLFTTNTKSKRTSEQVYIWVEDGAASLNVDLVRAGVFPGAVMADMVDNFNGLNELLKDPKLAATKAEIEKERAEAPQDRTERLIADDEYKPLMDRVEVAETQAHSEKLGIWSDAMKEEPSWASVWRRYAKLCIATRSCRSRTTVIVRANQRTYIKDPSMAHPADA
jgi:hypothetical protein